MVTKLYNEGKTTREIAKIARMSLRDIGIILRELNKEPEPIPPKSSRSKAFQMFSRGKNSTYVSIRLDLTYDEVVMYYREFLSLNNKTEFIRLCEKYKSHLPFVIELIEGIKLFQLSELDTQIITDYLRDSKNLNDRLNWLRHNINCLELRKNCLEDEIPNGKLPGL